MDNFLRFKEAAWFGDNKDIFIGGAGGIGSWLALFLARHGEHNIYIVDNDTVESNNLAGQLYSQESIGKYKVEALNDIVSSLSTSSLNTLTNKFEPGDDTFSITFSGFDNMSARKSLFESWKEQIDLNNKYSGVFIDGRMNVESYEIYCVTPDRISEYEEHLPNDEDVQDLPCSLKATPHIGAMIAADMVRCFSNFIVCSKEEDRRKLPFHIFSDGHLFQYKIK